MRKHKFKVGDRVRVIRIDNKAYYGDATFKIGDVGTIRACSRAIGCDQNDYVVIFDPLKANNKAYEWWVLESWLVADNQVMVCE